MSSITGFLLSISVVLYIGNGARTSSAQNQTIAPERPIWAANATALDLSCKPEGKAIQSPDRQSSVEVVCDEHEGEIEGEYVKYATYHLRIITADRHRYELPMDEGAHELLWAPNSRLFFVNGGENANAGFFVDVYQIDVSGVSKRTITGAAQKDMVRSFPPCKAWNSDEDTCAGIISDPEFNMSGLAWTKDSSAIFVFAEVPCDTLSGGIMCQVCGYELNVLDGRILKRLSALQTKQQWGKYAAWTIRVPEAPKYGRAHVTW